MLNGTVWWYTQIISFRLIFCMGKLTSMNVSKVGTFSNLRSELTITVYVFLSCTRSNQYFFERTSQYFCTQIFRWSLRNFISTTKRRSNYELFQTTHRSTKEMVYNFTDENLLNITTAFFEIYFIFSLLFYTCNVRYCIIMYTYVINWPLPDRKMWQRIFDDISSPK